MPSLSDRSLAYTIREALHPVIGGPGDFDPLLARAADARVVVLGAGAYGTHEFLRARAEITRRLVREHGFAAVALDADGVRTNRVSRYVHGAFADSRAADALGDFTGFPNWTMRNTDVVAFIDWLREHNATRNSPGKVRVVGLDMHGFHASLHGALEWLRLLEPDLARGAERRFACYDHVAVDARANGCLTPIPLAPDVERALVTALGAARADEVERARHDEDRSPDARFFAARAEAAARERERFDRALLNSELACCNLRARHMAENLDAFRESLVEVTASDRVVVWTHNVHAGDARGTEQHSRGQVSLGQILRERLGTEVLLVGLTSYSGTVTAASEWNGEPERMALLPSAAGSYEALLHECGLRAFHLDLTGPGARCAGLEHPRLERAIGLTYNPASERLEHYTTVQLPEQFDVVLHFDHTRAVDPLERTSRWAEAESAITGLHAWTS